MASIKKVASWYRGSTAQIQNAVESGILDKFSAVYNIDESTLYIYDTNGELKPIHGIGSTSLLFLNELPPVIDGDREKLYVVDNIVYTFTGDVYKPQWEDYQPEIDELNITTGELEETVSTHDAMLQDIVASLELEFI